MKKIFLVALLALTIVPASAKRQTNVVEVHTSCGIVAHIETCIRSTEEVMRQIMEINDAFRE